MSSTLALGCLYKTAMYTGDATAGWRRQRVPRFIIRTPEYVIGSIRQSEDSSNITLTPRGIYPSATTHCSIISQWHSIGGESWGICRSYLSFTWRPPPLAGPIGETQDPPAHTLRPATSDLSKHRALSTKWPLRVPPSHPTLAHLTCPPFQTLTTLRETSTKCHVSSDNSRPQKYLMIIRLPPR